MEIARSSGASHIFFHSDDESDAEIPVLSPAGEDAPVTSSSTDDTIVYDVDRYCRERNVSKPKRKRSKRPQPQTWKRNRAKDARLKGNAYIDRAGQAVPKRSMGPPCINSYCEVVGNQCRQISEHDRGMIFRYFWMQLHTEGERRAFVHSCVHRISDGAVRTKNKWTLKLTDGRCLTVCRKLFASTLGVPEKTLNTWLGRKAKSGPKQTKAARTGKSAPVADDDDRALEEWIREIPTVPSHYCRNTETYMDMKFVEPDATIAGLHRAYTESMEQQEKRALGIKKFSQKFHQLKYSVFRPKKDQCTTCTEGKLGHIAPQELRLHRAQKERAAEERRSDETLAKDDASVSVWTMDLQAVQVCPKSQSGPMFYRRKLQIHNLCFYCKETKDGFCYVWTETQGDLSSEMFAYIQQSHFRRVLRSPKYTSVKTLIVYSDGAVYQNKNHVIANGFLNLAIRKNLTVIQKFLVKGHTMMEVDSIHATIERKIKATDIFIPRDFIVVARTARINPRPYDVTMISHEKVTKLEENYLTSIRPGRRAGDPTVHDMRAVCYVPEGSVLYKLDFTEEWRILPQPVTLDIDPMWVQVFPAPLLITQQKYRDLQALKNVIPAEHHQFYDDLPHHSG